MRQPVGEIGQMRVYSQQAEVDYGAQLQAAHEDWEWAGRPETGSVTERLTHALADAYLIAPPESEEEAGLVAYAEQIGALPVIYAANTVYTRVANKIDHAERAKEVEQLWSRNPEVARTLTESYEREPGFLEAIATGDLSTDEIRQDLAERRAAAEEAVLAKRRFDEQTQLSEEFVRASALGLAPEVEEQYREEMARATDRATRVTHEDVIARRERRPHPRPRNLLDAPRRCSAPGCDETRPQP